MKIKPEDLMQTVLAADTLRRHFAGERISVYPRWKRIWIEPLFNLLGILVGQALASLPWTLRWRADQRINFWLGGRVGAQPANLGARCQEFAELAKRLHQETGEWPAVMVFTSHPLTSGPSEWLRFELVREGLLLANAVVDVSETGLYRNAPQCFLAIDPYALDTVATPVAGLYAGFMYRLYLAWDRMSGTQGWLQRHVFLRHSGHAHIAYRLLSRLKQHVPVVMVLPGGLPFNSRLLYAAREFVHHLPIRRWPYPKRSAQKKWMELLTRPAEKTVPLLKGELSDAVRNDLLHLLAEWGIPEPDQANLITVFENEFKLEAPYRRRLFRVLLARLVAKGTPFLWIAVRHQDQAPHVAISKPWAAYRTVAGDLRLIRGDGNPSEPLTDASQLAIDFSKEFVV